MSFHLSLLSAHDRSRAGRDWLELLAALIAAPGFDPLYRLDLIKIPPDHPVYGWGCQVPGCECVALGPGMCTAHEREWKALGTDKVRRADFLAGATPIKKKSSGLGTGSCRICPERVASDKGVRLCMRHRSRWRTHRIEAPGADLEQWAAAQEPIPGYGTQRRERAQAGARRDRRPARPDRRTAESLINDFSRFRFLLGATDGEGVFTPDEQ